VVTLAGTDGRGAGPRGARAVAGGLALALLLTAAGCQPPAGGTAAGSVGKPAAPAKVEGAPKEADLATVTLTPEAEAHLGLATGTVKKQAVPRVVLYPGEVVIPTGRLFAVTAPIVGTVKAPPGKPGLPAAGDDVAEGQPVCSLVPILSPEAMATMIPLLVDAEGQVQAAREALHIAKVAYDRAEGLVRDRLGGQAALIDAKAAYDQAVTNLKNAENLLASRKAVMSDTESGNKGVQTIAAPASGTVQNVHVSPGQKVAAGAALFEVAGLDPVWVKVPVYVGEVARIDPKRPAEISGLTDSPGAPGARPGKPVAAPPSGDPLAATVHLFYEVANQDRALSPGERVGVTLPLKGSDESLTVPRASLVRDIYGGVWVYEKVAPHKYARRRVLVDRVVGDLAVLASAPLKPDATVVTDAAAELYGSEFGGGK
jgi:RND family efflux transporter MFP subunit